MKSLNLATEELPGLEVAFPSGEKKVIRRKKITPRIYGEWSKGLEELGKMKESGDISEADYAIEMVLHVSEGITREDMLDLDMPLLAQLAQAVREMITPESPAEKKSESGAGTTPDSYAVGSPTPS